MSRTESGRDGLVHWIGEHNNTLHGNGYGSRDMEHASGDEEEVTCRLCHSLLARRARELAEYAEHPPTPAEEPAEVAHHYEQGSDEGHAYSRGWHNGYDAGWDAARRASRDVAARGLL